MISSINQSINQSIDQSIYLSISELIKPISQVIKHSSTLQKKYVEQMSNVDLGGGDHIYIYIYFYLLYILFFTRSGVRLVRWTPPWGRGPYHWGSEKSWIFSTTTTTTSTTTTTTTTTKIEKIRNFRPTSGPLGGRPGVVFGPFWPDFRKFGNSKFDFFNRL